MNTKTKNALFLLSHAAFLRVIPGHGRHGQAKNMIVARMSLWYVSPYVGVFNFCTGQRCAQSGPPAASAAMERRRPSSTATVVLVCFTYPAITVVTVTKRKPKRGHRGRSKAVPGAGTPDTPGSATSPSRLQHRKVRAVGERIDHTFVKQNDCGPDGG